MFKNKNIKKGESEMKKLIWNKIFKNQGKCFSGGY